MTLCYMASYVLAICLTLLDGAWERSPSSGKGLPEFDAVAFGVPDPSEVAVAIAFPIWVDADAGLGQLGKQAIEVVDAEVEHEGLRAISKVGGFVREGREDGHSGGFGSVEGQRTAILGWDAEVGCIPVGQGRGVAGFEEDSSYSDCFSQVQSS